MKLIATKDATSQIVYVFIRDSSATTGVGLTGLAYNSASLVAYYVRPGGSATAITLATQTTTGAYSSGGFVEVSSTNMPGVYRFDVPNAVLATGVDSAVVMLKGATNMEPVVIEFQLIAANLQDAVHFGITGIPNAAAGASGGIPINGANAGNVSFSGTVTYTGNVTYSDGITVSAPSTSNRSGVTITGNGTGSGVLATGGATGHGVSAVGGATSGNGIRAAGTAGNSVALNLIGQGSAAGLLSTGGATGHGISAVGGATSGDGISAAAATSGHGLTVTGVGTTKHGLNATGGSTSSHGISAAGGGTGSGLRVTGGATGTGIGVVGGGTSGNGINVTTTSGHGVNLAPVGTDAHGLLVTGGNGGTSDGLKAVAGTGGVPIRGNITGNITGTIDTVATLTNAPSDSSGTTTLLSRLSSARAGYLDNLSAGAVALASSLSTLSGIFTGITSLAQWLGLIAGKQTGNSTARTEIRATGAGSGTFDETTDSQEALRDRGDAAWTTATGFSTLDAAGVRSAVGLASANLDTQLDALPTAAENATAVWGAGTRVLTAIDEDTTTLDLDATIRAAVGLASANMDTQLAAIDDAVDTEVAAIKVVTDKLGGMIETTTDGDIFTAVALQNAPGAGSAPTASEIADAVWDEAIAGHAISGSTGEALAAAGAAGDPWITALPGSYSSGQAGYIVGTNLNATVSSRAASSVLGTPAGASIAADIAAVKVDTAATLVDTAEIGSAGAGLTALASAANLATLTGYVDTEVASIKAKTDNLPAAPAAVSDIPTAVENADALLKRDWTSVTGEAARSALNALRFLRNKWTLVGTTLSVKEEDDSTEAWTAEVSTTPGADPITGSDPA